MARTRDASKQPMGDESWPHAWRQMQMRWEGQRGRRARRKQAGNRRGRETVREATTKPLANWPFYLSLTP